MLALLIATPASGAAPLEEFQANLRSFLKQRCLKEADVGLMITSLQRGDVLFEANAGKLLIPASNIKILTAAAALDRLHSDYTFKTWLATDGVKNGRVLQGNLYLVGGGDPSLVPEQLWLLAQKVRTLGIDMITGGLYYDDSYFDDTPYVRGWDGASAEAYHAPINALSLNFNIITLHAYPADQPRRLARVILEPESRYVEILNSVTTGPAGGTPNIVVSSRRNGDQEILEVSGSLPLGSPSYQLRRAIIDPARFTAATFREYLLLQGTRIFGETSRRTLPKHVAVLVRHDSKPLSTIIADLNKFSNNFVAEQLLKNLGAEQFGPPGSTAKGVRAVAAFLARLGLAETEFRIADGSGLSTFNRLSARVLVRVLRTMFNDFEVLPEFMGSLGIVGADGLVQRRLQGTEAERNLRVKTGTLAGASSLSGYARAANKELLAFAYIVNGGPCGHAQLRQLQNRLSLMLVKFSR
ncbi:MAG: D-alanyl-D-alanine carboxypeptidase/D-alanyl-D-alanine-endopeptidase [Candidatus Tectomicrobia bacterium]|nr:D-alanyl-D-alanine carboxypeptidase/D-alanyl-D-alanine-endopeptidase [Candidatus Tectomicrobia bacterium]